MTKKLKREFFVRDVLDVAPDLLGKTIVMPNKNVYNEYIITEVEAYRGEEDLACHASKGRTQRTEIMYNTGGFVYVYLVYGMYWMLNFVTGQLDQPQAALIRGIKNCSGPGRLTKKLDINKSFYGVDLTISKRIWLADNGLKPKYNTSPRVGIDYSGEFWKNIEWRYKVLNSNLSNL